MRPGALGRAGALGADDLRAWRGNVRPMRCAYGAFFRPWSVDLFCAVCVSYRWMFWSRIWSARAGEPATTGGFAFLAVV